MTRNLSLEDALIYRAVLLLRGLVHALPLRVSLRAARAVGWVVACFVKRRDVAYRNLRAAFAGEYSDRRLRSIARESIQQMAMAAVELLRAPDLTRDYLERHVRIEGRERLRERLDRGEGLIFLTAHFGNWEMLNLAAGILGYPMVALARVQKHPRSDAYLNSLRTSQGTQIILKGMSVREILRALRAGKIVGILSDQDGGRQGTFVDFFGRRSSSPSGVATFAIKTGSPIYPVFIFREGLDGHRVEVEGPLSAPETADQAEAQRHILQEFAAMLESRIRRSPGQWLWAHRRWKSTPDRHLLILSDGKAGHLAQSQAVAQAIRRERAGRGLDADRVFVRVLEPRFRSRAARILLELHGRLFGGGGPFARQVLSAALEPGSARDLRASYADVVISCGSSVAALNLYAKRMNLARSVVVMKPPFRLGGYDSVIAPRHDGLRPSARVHVTAGALSPIDENALSVEGARLAGELGLNGRAPTIGLLIGGDTDRLSFEPALLEEAIRQIRGAAETSGARVLATTSRRTPGWADTLLKNASADRERFPLVVIANEANRPGVVGGILGLADVLVVSGESVSMVSESVATGKPVVVFWPSSARPVKAKYRQFLDTLESEGRIVRSRPEQLSDSLARLLAEDRACTPRRSAAEDRRALDEAVRRVAA